MTGDFLFGFACGVGACLLLVILVSLLSGRRRRSTDPGPEPCSDL